MRFEFKSSFDRSLKSFHKPEQEEIKKATRQTIEMFLSDRNVTPGAGLKQLRRNYWEVRKGLKARILFRWQGDLIEFIFAGDHNDIKRFLKRL
jgi:mRNA-degrading endonuclease RelE of RelBE toxin-antitoxin system